MLLPALVLAFFGSSTPASVPITVTGRAWAPFISPMGEPFRARSTADDTMANWFRRADRNGDGILTAEEMQADADRFFGTLDTDHDGEIGPEELVNYEWEVAPEIQVNSRRRRPPGNTSAASLEKRSAYSDEDGMVREGHRRRTKGDGLQGAARYGLLNIPEPVAAADADFNRGISSAEFRQAALERFRMLDSAGQGRLSLVQLQALRTAALAAQQNKHDEDAPDPRVGSPLPKAD